MWDWRRGLAVAETGPRWSGRRIALALGLALSLAVCLVLGAAGCGPLPDGTGGSGQPPGGPGVPGGPGSGLLPATTLAVHFIDVGQGDAILIEPLPGRIALIDGGPPAAAADVVAYLRGQGVEQIHLLIATHPHSDHIGGLPAVLAGFPVTRVIDSGAPHTTDVFELYLAAVEAEVQTGGCVYETPEDQVVQLAANVTLTVLGPDAEMSSLNNSSVVCRLDFGTVSFLFPGDAETAAEQALAGAQLQADVLKVGHHGGATSTSAAFLAAVDPDRAVVSVGENSYGHPTAAVLNRLRGAGVKVYRTDVTGTIVFESDGQVLSTSAPEWTPPTP